MATVPFTTVIRDRLHRQVPTQPVGGDLHHSTELQVNQAILLQVHEDRPVES